MASQPLNQAGQQVALAQHIFPPSARELRAHAVQRLQVGMFGLAAMLLLVGLANIISDHARVGDAVTAGGVLRSPSMVEEPAEETDPLADIGVVPSAGTSDAVPASGADSPAN